MGFKKTNFVFLVLIFFGILSAQIFSAVRAQSGKNSQMKPDLKQIEQLVDLNSNELVTAKRQLTFDGPRAGEGYFSQDGQKMIFQSERDPKNPFYQMYVMDLISGETSRLSTGRGQTTCGWLHPDGKTAMWSSTHLDPKFDDKVKTELAERSAPVKKRYSWSFDDTYSIFSSDLKGKNLKQLTKEKGYNAEGSYSPDGKRIAFASNRNGYLANLSESDLKMLGKDPSYFMDIFIMDADGKNVKQLTAVPGYDGGPFFSADGQKITWRRFSENGMTAEIFTMNVDGSEQKKITSLNAMSWAPYFHPSGDYIIFGTSILGMANFELFIVDSLGLQKPVRVSFSEGFDGLASFSPDGRSLTWSHRNDKGDSQIYISQWNDDLARKLLKLTPPNEPVKNPLAGLSPEISIVDAQKIIQYLASEYFKGRPTGGELEKEYSVLIANLFEKWGLKPAVGNSFLQTFDFVSGVNLSGKNEAQFKGRFQAELKLNEEYQIVSSSKSGKFVPGPIVFVGYGITAPASTEMAAYDSYRDMDVKNKWVMFFSDAPRPAQREFKKHTHLVSFSRLQHKISLAKKNGASGIVIVEEGKVGSLRFEGSLAENQLPIIRISGPVFEKLMASQNEPTWSLKKLREKFETYDFVPGFILPSQYLAAEISISPVRSTGINVIGQLEPDTGVQLKSPGLLIGAHGDHLGLGQMGSSLASGEQKNRPHYGADDNASGVSGVLELAQFFANQDQRKKLKKPITFAIWSGEEVGILGSTHFVKDYKSKKGKNFKDSFEASLNMDMIGRLDQSLQIQGLGSSLEWSKLLEPIAAQTDLNLVTTSDPYLPTDSMAMYVGGTPSISFFTGAHLDYHTPSDTPDKINYPGLIKIIHVVKNLSAAIATNPKKILFYNQVEGSSGSQPGSNRSFKIFLGTIPDYSQEGVKGVRISGTSKNSPAELAGLLSGDIIVEFDKVQIENIYDYVYTLQTVKPDLKTQIKVQRSSQLVELSIVPKLKE